jgi:threonyl-tRNA synthetase
MVHRALYGSSNAFFGVLIEHYAGAFPVWLSAVQAVMIPISERHAEYANKVADQLKAVGVRVHVDARNEKMNAKIREHAMQKVPFLLVVGDKEAEAGNVNVRTRGKEKTEDMPAVEFVARIKGLIEQKSPPPVSSQIGTVYVGADRPSESKDVPPARPDEVGR